MAPDSIRQMAYDPRTHELFSFHKPLCDLRRGHRFAARLSEALPRAYCRPCGSGKRFCRDECRGRAVGQVKTARSLVAAAG